MDDELRRLERELHAGEPDAPERYRAAVRRSGQDPWRDLKKVILAIQVKRLRDFVHAALPVEDFSTMRERAIALNAVMNELTVAQATSHARFEEVVDALNSIGFAIIRRATGPRG